MAIMRQGHYIMIKRSVQQKDSTLVNIYAPNVRGPKYIKQVLTDIMGETHSNTVIVWDVNTPLTSADRSSIQNQHRNHGLKRCIRLEGFSWYFRFGSYQVYSPTTMVWN